MIRESARKHPMLKDRETKAAGYYGGVVYDYGKVKCCLHA